MRAHSRSAWLHTAFAATLLVFMNYAPVAGADVVPFRDENATGYIGFCDKSGHEITSGRIDDKPFVWTAVSSVPPPPAYTKAHRGKATFYAYQPRKDVDPGEWSASQLTAGSSFTSDEHPMAQATTLDPTLSEFLEAYPANWDGLVQLRMIFTAPNTPAHTTTYPATVIKVSGGSWTLVSGGAASCDAGKAVSAEVVYLPSSTFAPKQSATTGAASSTPASVPASPAAAGTKSANPGVTNRTGPANSKSPTGTAAVAGGSSASGASGGSTASTKGNPNAAGVAPSSSDSPNSAASPSTAGSPAGEAPVAKSVAAGATSAHSSSTPLVIASLALLALLGGGFGWWAKRRRVN